MIPRTFIACGYDLADKVFLKAPASSVWKVELERTNGEVMLWKGWPEFAAYYSICVGHILMFRYEGNSIFHFHHRFLFETLVTDETEPAGIEKPNTVIPSQANGTQLNRIKPVKVEVDIDNPRQHVITAIGARESATEEGKARALTLAKAFKSNKPFFILKVQPSHISKRGVHVPKAFKEAYEKWKKSESERVIIRFAERTWLADCIWTSIGYRLKNGWYKFAMDSSLAVGDVCVFELVNPSKRMFKVIIYRAKAKDEKW
ncbi:B3 domain-containing transcription factor VRN1-like [Apium graveolens]|uniref:B3 domain-containing transcription factor VRN1-like n=1 Tax=Apium graveolens TaxID=4045 RepID=UPI003D7AD543